MNENIRIQEVDSVEKPPKARVESATDTSERKKDYLDGFLAQKPLRLRKASLMAICTRR